MSNKKIESRKRPNLRINHLPPQRLFIILPLLRIFVKEKTRRLQSSSLSKQIQKQKLLLQHLYSIMKSKFCQRKKSDDFSTDYHERRYMHRTTIPTHSYSISRNRNLVNENHCLRKCIRGPL